jgi:hypothetical protein
MENRANEEFNKYVAEHKDQERHTPKAVQEADDFFDFISSQMQDKPEMIEQLWERFMDGCVEYEVSGFIAGYQKGYLSAKSEAKKK